MPYPLRRSTLAATLAVACALALTTAAPARADDRTAETLYQEGKAAAKNKDWAVACAKFKESHAREPAPGTLLNLGDCEEQRGQFAQAIADFEAAARLCKPGDERADYARQRSFALERRAPKLTLRLHRSTPAGTTVERDGAAVATTQIGAPVLVDPGEHALVVRAPGRAEMRGTVRLVEGETREIELTAGMPITNGTSTPTPNKDDPTKARAHEETPGEGGSLRTAAFVSLGVGAVALGVGVVGGLLTMSAKSTADQHCPTQGCDADGLSAESRGKTWGTVGTVGFVVGGVGLATGVGLLLFAPKAAARPATGGLSLTPTTGGAQVRWAGTF